MNNNERKRTQKSDHKEKIAHSNYGRDFLKALFHKVVMGAEL